MIGKKLAHYEITSELGKGGMGEVWRARDTKLGREVAIKTLPEDFAADAGRLARFEREARLLASLNHPNIAAIYGHEVFEGTRFLVLELVEGETLSERLKRGPLSIEESLALARQIAEALEAAHDKGVIHRDLKPANIKITPDGNIKVLDYGLAKALTGDAVAESDLTSSPTLSMQATRYGVILGTAAYMSPEQARGEAVDKRADIWAFGCVLYEMLTGRTTFDGRTASDVLAGVLRAEPDWNLLPPTLHPRLREVLERCLEKEAKNRWHDIADVRVDLEKLLKDPVAPVVEKARVEPRPVLPWVVGTFVLTAAVVAMAVWNLKPSEPKAVTRFVHDLPKDQRLSGVGRMLVAIAPDGSRLVYVANDQLYLRNLDEAVAHPIAGTDETRNPFFSPDGEWIGYWADGQLKKIAVGGGVPVPICEAATPPFDAVWHEDDTIVYSSGESVMRVSADGGTPERLIATDDSILAPRLLPDGETLLFVLVDEQGPHIAVQSLASGERKLLHDGGRVQYVSTGHLVYGRDGALFAMPFDVGSLELVGGPVALVEGVDRAQYAISDTGTLVYVDRGSVDHSRILALANRNGDIDVLDAPPAEYLSPRLSPDGKKLVVQTLDQGVGVLWIYDLSRDRAIQQFSFEGDNQYPIWTPDGERVTFASDRDGTMSLYWKRADGRGVAERLTTADEGTSHWPSSWSPDEQVLAYMVQTGARQGDWDVWTLSIDGNAAESLYDVPETVHMGPVFSPDGRWMAYGFGDIPGSQDIYVEPFPPTGARRRISQDGGLFPMWSRAGTELFYRPTVSRGGTTGVSLRVVDIATEPDFAFSNERSLPLDRFVVVAFYRDYDIMPDGEKLLMMFPEGVTDASGPPPQRIHVVLNWFEELKERVPTNR